MNSIADQINALEPGTIRVFRDSESDIGYREAILYVDDEQARSIQFKEMVEIFVRPGTHTLRASNRVFKSKKFTFNVEPGQRVTFQVANTGRGLYVFFMLLCMGIPRIELRQDAPEHLEKDSKLDSRRLFR